MRLARPWLAALAAFGLAGAAAAQQTVTFPDFCNTTGLTVNGNAASLNPNPQCVLRLTNALAQSSSAFLTSAFSLASDASFSTFFKFQMTNPMGIGDGDGTGADGIVFAVQTVSNTAGGGGGGIGYEGISPSVGIELDTFNNGAQDQNDGNHIGADVNGNVTSVALTHIDPRFNDGEVWFAWVDYNGATKVLEGRVNKTGIRPASPNVSTTVDLPAVLGTTNAFVGFTSGTGSGGNNHEILSWQIIGAFQPIGNPTATPTPTSTTTPVPTLTATPTQTPTRVSVVVPTLSFPMTSLLVLALAGAALFYLKPSH